MSTEKYAEFLSKQAKEGQSAGLFGTRPTGFVQESKTSKNEEPKK